MTRYIFLITELDHPQSPRMTLYYFTKAQKLNSAQKVRLLNKIMIKQAYLTKNGYNKGHNIAPKFKPSKYALKRLEYDTKLEHKFSVASIYGTPYFIIKGHTVVGLNIKKIFKLTGIKTVNTKKIKNTLQNIVYFYLMSCKTN